MEKKYLSRDNIVGKQVIDSSAMIIGNVKDLAFDFEKKEIALAVTTRAGGEITVAGSDVNNVGDIVLLNKKVELPAVPSTPTPSVVVPSVAVPPSAAKEAVPPQRTGLCPMCNYQNDVNSRFCIKCGAKLQ